MRRPHLANRGFVMLTALLIMALVAVAIVALASATTSDGKRTLYQWESAQLDQLLLAGAVDSTDRLNSREVAAGDAWAVELPGALASEGAGLNGSVDTKIPGMLTIRISATLNDRRAEQRLTFQREGDAWKLADATLED